MKIANSNVSSNPNSLDRQAAAEHAFESNDTITSRAEGNPLHGRANSP